MIMYTIFIKVSAILFKYYILSIILFNMIFYEFIIERIHNITW